MAKKKKAKSKSKVAAPAQTAASGSTGNVAPGSAGNTQNSGANTGATQPGNVPPAPQSQPKPKSETKGGVVNIADVIDQMANMTKSFENAIDVVLNTSSAKSLQVKTLRAKTKFKIISGLVCDLATYLKQTMDEMSSKMSEELKASKKAMGADKPIELPPPPPDPVENVADGAAAQPNPIQVTAEKSSGGQKSKILDILKDIQDMVKIFDTIVNTAVGAINPVKLFVKTKKAKIKLMAMFAMVKDLILFIQKSITKLKSDIDLDAVSKDLKFLMATDKISKILEASEEKKKEKPDDNFTSSKGLFDILYILLRAVNSIAMLDFPRPVKFKAKLSALQICLGTLQKSVSEIYGSVKKLGELSQEDISESLKFLMSGGSIKQIVEASDPKNGEKKEEKKSESGSKKGLFDVLSTIISAVNTLNVIPFPNPGALIFKLLMLQLCLKSLGELLTGIFGCLKYFAILANDDISTGLKFLMTGGAVVPAAEAKNIEEAAKDGEKIEKKINSSPQKGLFDIIGALINALNTINVLPIPNPVSLIIKLAFLNLNLVILQKTLPEIFGSIKALAAISNDDISTSLDALMGGGSIAPVVTKNNTESNPGAQPEKKQGSKKGIFDILTTISGAIYSISAIGYPNPIALTIKLMMLWGSLVVLQKLLPKIVNQINSLAQAVGNNNPEQIKNIIGVKEMMDAIAGLIASIGWKLTLLALLLPVITIIAPLAALSVYIMAKCLKWMIMALHAIGNPEMIAAVKMIVAKVKTVVRTILRAILLIAATIAVMMLVIIACVAIGVISFGMFLQFVQGLLAIALMFVIMRVVFWIMAKLANQAAKMSVQALINIAIIAGIILILALIFLVLSLAADKVIDNLLTIIIFLGIMMLVLFAIVGFLALCGVLSPAIIAGTAAVAVVVLGIVCVMLLVGLLWLLTYIADYLDPARVEDAVDKVVDCVASVIRSLFNAKFMDPDTPKTGGIVGALLYILGGEMLNGIFSLMMKVSILFMAVFALALITIVTMLLIGMSKLYYSNSDSINKAPKAIDSIFNVCGKVIQTILKTKTGVMPNKSDGVFLALMGWVFGEDWVAIFRILFRVVIVMLTLVLLAMVRFLCTELMWLTKYYKEHKAEIDATPGIVTEIMVTCTKVIEAVTSAGWGISFNEADGAFMQLITWVSPELGTIVNLLFKILIIGLAMAVLAMLKVLMDQLLWLKNAYAKMGGNEMITGVETMVSDIMTSINNIITSLSSAADTPNGKARSGLAKLLDWLGMSTLAQVIDLMCSFAMVGLAVLSLSVLLGVANMMKTCWDTYQAMGGENIGKNAKAMTKGLGDGINSIIAALTEIEIKAPEEAEAPTWAAAAAKIFGSWVKDVAILFGSAGKVQNAVPVLTALSSISRMMSSMADSIKKASGNGSLKDSVSDVTHQLTDIIKIINEIEIGDLNVLDANLQKIETVITKISGTFNRLLGMSEKKAALDTLLKQSAQYTKVVRDTEKLVNRINGLDLAKMNALAKMFGNAAAFSQSINGNFDRLANVINEKIAPLIEGLKEAVENADKTIKAKAQNDLKVAQINKQTAETNAKAAADKRATNNPIAPTLIPKGANDAKKHIAPAPARPSRPSGIAGQLLDALETATVKVKVVN